MSHFIVGLTGGIGSGKSAVSERFAKLGVGIVDADIVSRQVVEPGTAALASIAQHFGKHLLLNNGQLDRAALRQTIFSQPDAKTWLEALLHPLIAAETIKQLNDIRSSYAMYVSPLLVESKQQTMCQRLVVVDVPVKIQLERTMSRDSNEQAQVERIIASQASREERLAAASDVIDNTANFADLDRQVSTLHLQFLKLARATS
ncbi:Dephospho-CoA kinase [Zhongshania aliphaticivorans]|uniref:Dephospho-CoA kinase n=1 Tax=Zhongshania aliphaticivorans TaxID=1470434 RepID=A0A5S9N0B2_9GAMM|nr:dephospho-CoA kinase [Zhongshania aliphaticivorans]CAA0083032.1 Dephospho-CoA kinase [Zhongshania aliphaticivorans]CAA0083728.1 Dephospho-CoA kinase [Zhongshania aliphaticivorans]